MKANKTGMSIGTVPPETEFGTMEFWRARCKKLEGSLEPAAKLKEIMDIVFEKAHGLSDAEFKQEMKAVQTDPLFDILMESGLQPYYQAFLRERKAENHEYIAWIGAKHREFRALNQIPDGPYSETIRQEFENWL